MGAVFYTITLALMFFYPSLATAKEKRLVCSITINSDDEIKTFKKFLSSDDFQFVELLPAKKNPEKDHTSHWFDEACQKNYKCDILVVSGHFGGTFFGESDYTLPTELLEEKACRNQCSGILSQAKEIFLFGCNTLASKKKDKRTYREYLQVLLDDGLAKETAERVVAARYSPLETPFYARMNFIFSGSSSIYGFEQLSPLGEHIRPSLEKYFRSINKAFGSYANYLQTGQYKRPLNTELFKYLPRNQFSLNQAHLSLSDESPEKRKFFQDKCLLYDKNTNKLPRKIQALRDIFESKQAGSAFFAIDDFLDYNKKTMTEGQGRKTFRWIRTHSSFAQDFLSYYEHLSYLPYIKIVYLNILEKFQWMDPSALHIYRKKALLELIKKPNYEAYASLMSLLGGHKIQPHHQFYISKKDLPDNYARSLYGLLILQKLKAFAPDFQEDILQNCEGDTQRASALCYQALNTLAHIGPHLKIAQKSAELLNYKDEELIFYTVSLLGQSKIKNYQAHKKIASLMAHSNPQIREEALKALCFLKTPYQDIHTDMAQLLGSLGDSPSAELLKKKILSSFNCINVKSASAQKQIIQYALRQPHDKNFVKQVFSALQNTSDFSDFALSFFYRHLESRDDPEFLLLIIEIISKNKNLKSLGIHYRLLQFYKEESDLLKQKALEKMAGLSWLHPETQIEFLLGYIAYDTNPKTRKLAVNVLKNIKNLQAKAFQRIKSLYQERGIEELSVFFL